MGYSDRTLRLQNQRSLWILGFWISRLSSLRHHFCVEELRLNQRFAPQIYLDVVTGWRPQRKQPGNRGRAGRSTGP